MTDYTGARGSNTGDDFHELWAARQALRLLNAEDDLQALSVEGILERTGGADTWEGVDCALYFGGRDAASASHVRIEQLKYSGSSPESPWTIARLTRGTSRGRSVVARLAKAWKEMRALRIGASPPAAALVTNQPVAPELLETVRRAAATTLDEQKRQPRSNAPDEIKLAYASCLAPEDFREFASSLDLISGVGSRFTLEDRVLRAIAAWTDEDARGLVLTLRRFVRDRMLPENERIPISHEAVMLHALGASDKHALFPCPADIRQTERLVQRAAVEQATHLLLGPHQYLCLHGEGGVGKTTALQQLEKGLPRSSVMVTFDCYGGGRYLDPAALRHRHGDAFVQLANEVAAKLRLPLLLSRHHTSDFPRLFMHRLRHAAETLAAASPDSLLVIAIDAADNSVTAARERNPTETSFVHDFVLMNGLPSNVRFVVTARTGRVDSLRLPERYAYKTLSAFSREETAKNVQRFWEASDAWVDDFHQLSAGVPRVQSYAFEGCTDAPEAALERLRPGKSLADVFDERFREAQAKNGNPQEVANLCAGLAALARPVPLKALAAVLELPEAQVRDTCSDLAPGIRLEGATVGFADEDFESFVRERAEPELPRVRALAATWLLSQARVDSYAALHVAPALSAAGQYRELLDLVENEPSPSAVRDPIQKREAEVQRLRLALSASREAGNASRALRYVLLGAEGVGTDKALRQLLADNPDLAARFAPDTIGRQLLSDPGCRPTHGPLRFHQLVIHAERRDTISYREGQRLIGAWLEARELARSETNGTRSNPWPIHGREVAADAEAAFKLEGPTAALDRLYRWRPLSARLSAGLSLPSRLIAEGRAEKVGELLAQGYLGPISRIFVQVPLALAGLEIDMATLEFGLSALSKRIAVTRFLEEHQDRKSQSAELMDLLLTGCEILAARDPARTGLDQILDLFLTSAHRRLDRRHVSEPSKLDAIFRAYALREARAGRLPGPAEIFEPRLNEEPQDAKHRRTTNEGARRRDRELREFTETVFPLYAAVAYTLTAGRRRREHALDALQSATDTFERNSWRLREFISSKESQACAARHVLVLLAADHEPKRLMDFALRIDGDWRKAHGSPDEGLISRLSLRSEIHEPLMTALADAASGIYEMRMGARDKADTLVRYARLMVPLSPSDAAHVFYNAATAAVELGTEVCEQLVMLEALIKSAGDATPKRRETALFLAEVVADAAVRLDGYDHFPWRESMAALSRLDASIALAATARWDARGAVSSWKTLPHTLRTCLDTGVLSPSQASALALALQHDKSVLPASLARARDIADPKLAALCEEAARDLLVRSGREGKPSELLGAAAGVSGPWVAAALAQDRFERTLPHPQADPKTEPFSTPTNDAIAQHTWTSDIVIEGATLARAARELHKSAHEGKTYLSMRDILIASRAGVLMKDRRRHLDALAWIANNGQEHDAVYAITDALGTWRTLAAKAWAIEILPNFVKKWLPSLARGLPYGMSELTQLLDHTRLPNDSRSDLLLGAIQSQVDALPAEVIFALVALIGGMLPNADVADVSGWYTRRLVQRVPAEHREYIGTTADLPATVEEAIARFLMAQMGSADTRVRWRAAHAVRRLGRTDEWDTIAAFVTQYGRHDEPVFSGPSPAFYPLAARLWATIALDRMSGERPDVASLAARQLLSTALDDSFPHLLLRAFARHACRKLVELGMLEATPTELACLEQVNKSLLTRVKAENRVGNSVFKRERKGRRFHFDSVDTLPYWYEPMLRSFAKLSGDSFLDEAERWIVDVWGWDQSKVEGVTKMPQRYRGHEDWLLEDHRHGSTPTVEPLDTHLEWHAMWCAAGELLKTIPLAEDESDGWDALESRIRREQLSEPPLWSADLLVPTPLHRRYCALDSTSLSEWTAAAADEDHRVACLPPDRADYVVVEGQEETTFGDRSQTVKVSSALVEPLAALALLRALQTVDDPVDYKLPDEGEDQFEIDETPYRLLGWIRRPQRDQGIDEKDPFRGYARYVEAIPGRRVHEVCGLTREPSGAPRWSRGTSAQPMFVYEVWGGSEDDEENRNRGQRSRGRRLLAHRAQLLEFLRGEGLDLVVEVEVTRRGRETQRYAGAEDVEAPKVRFDRIYLLDQRGGLHIAEGHLGAWTGVAPQP